MRPENDELNFLNSQSILIPVPGRAVWFLKPGIMNRGHIVFFIVKMLKGMVLKIFYGFLTNPLAFFLHLSQIKKPVEYAEQLLMLLVNEIYSYIVPVIPYKLIFHSFASFYQYWLSGIIQQENSLLCFLCQYYILWNKDGKCAWGSRENSRKDILMKKIVNFDTVCYNSGRDQCSDK